MKINPRIRKILDWVIPIAIIGGLYISGYLPEVSGSLQSIMVKTGLVDASPNKSEDYGQIKSDFVLIDQAGSEIHYSDLEGKVLFINLWATWCPPCIAELPDIEGLVQEMESEEDIEFILLNLDKDPQKALEFLTRKELDLPVFFKASALPSELSVRSIPTTFVVGKTGRIVFQHSGIASYNNDSFKSFLKKEL